MKTILTLAANPDDTSALQLNREIRDIRSQLQQAKYREEFEFIRRDAARWEDVQRVILEIKPRIIHFCGHGAGEPGLILERGQGEKFVVSTEILADLFKQVASRVECVLLNACYSQAQAQAISQHINYVIGMSQAIEDNAAVAYAKGFYLAVGAGESIEHSHATGCREIRVSVSDVSLASRDIGLIANSNKPGVTAGATHLMPQLFIKTPLTSFADPLGISARQPATQGFSVLADLLANPAVYEAVVVFRSDFKVLCEQIGLLSYYKQLHDLLHQLEIECYRNIIQEARRFLDDEMAVTMLSEYDIVLQGIIQTAYEILAQQVTSVQNEVWVGKLENAQVELAAAIAEWDHRRLKKSIFLMTQLLGSQPVRLNAKLTETAKTLRLSELVERLRQLQATIYRLGLSADQLAQFEQELASLEDLGSRLNQHVQSHDAWQEIDAVLRRIENNLSQDTEELAWSWPDLKLAAAALYGDCAEPARAILVDCEQKLDAALADNTPAKVKHHFRIYRRAALNHFSQVDIQLIRLCKELQAIGQSLALVLEKLS
jgi:hypothetical protein